MYRILILFFLLISSTANAALTVGNVPKVKTGGTTPSLQNSAMYENAGNVGIGTSTATSKLQVSGTVTATAFSGALTGNVTGNADTATALAANGANCSAGNAPLGVDASGAVESCFDVLTQTEFTTHESDITAVHGLNIATPADGHLFIYDGVTDNRFENVAMSGDVTITAAGVTAIGANTVALTTDTTGNYVADVAGTTNEITSTHTPGEGSTATISLPATIDLGGKTSFELPNGASPTVDAFGEIAGDNDLWAASRGAPVFYDGTAAVALLGTLVTDTPSNGQVPKWNTGGTITWEADSTGAGGGDEVSIDSVAVVNPDFVSTGQIDFVDTSNTVTANINDNGILEADLKAVDTAADEECLTYETTTGDFEWQTCGGAGSSAYSSITAPTANHSIEFASYTNIWTSTMDGNVVFQIDNTDADLLASTVLMRLEYTDDGDAEGLFLQARDNNADTKFQVGADGAVTTTGTITAGTGAIVLTNATGNIDGTKVANADLGEVVVTGGAWAIDADSVALTTDTTGNYAAGDAEAGAALTGDSATSFFAAGTIERARGGLAADTSAYGAGLIGSDGSNNTIDVDTEAELETALGSVDVVTVTASDITSANLATALSDETGTGVVVFGTAPTITTSVTVPLVIGGSGTTQTLTYKTTTGVGATGADHIFQVGNNGATEAMRILNDGNVGIGTSAPVGKLQVAGTGNVGIGTTGPLSLLHVKSGYTQIDYTVAGAPTAGDCDSDTEYGRMIIDTTNERLYICNGATRAWDYVALTD